MKKKTWLMIGVLFIVGLFGFGMYQSSASQGAPTLSAESIKELITSQYPGEVTSLELTQGKNGAVYELEIENDNIVYELKVNGQSGEILSLREKMMLTDKGENNQDTSKQQPEKATEQDQESKTQQETKTDRDTKLEKKDTQDKKDVAQSNDTEKNEKNHHDGERKQDTNHKNDKQYDEPKHKENKKQKNQKKTGIDIQQAIDIALEHFPGVVEEVELEKNNGRLIYEIEIEADGEEAEFEIDAYTGEILIVEIDD